MGVQIKTPNITAGSDRERLMQIQSYLYQMAQQLQWAFDTIQVGGGGTSGPSVPQTQQAKAAVPMDPASTFAGLKNLIIKSADIVNAYYETINSRLEGLYVAQSDFGTYAQKTALDIQGNSESISQLFSNEQLIFTNVDTLISRADSAANRIENLTAGAEGMASRVDDLSANAENMSDRVDGLASDADGLSSRVDGLSSDANELSSKVDGLATNADTLSSRVDEIAQDSKDVAESLAELTAVSLLTNAYLKTGLLYYKEDGTPVYGLEIGQTNSVGGENIFDKFARFAADRLSFFDSNDVEVAYISDYKLYITNAEITGTLWITGRFKIYYNGGLAFQWIGGDS